MNITVSWDATPYSLVDNCQRFLKNLLPPSSGYRYKLLQSPSIVIVNKNLDELGMTCSMHE